MPIPSSRDRGTRSSCIIVEGVLVAKQWPCRLEATHRQKAGMSVWPCENTTSHTDVPFGTDSGDMSQYGSAFRPSTFRVKCNAKDERSSYLYISGPQAPLQLYGTNGMNSMSPAPTAWSASSTYEVFARICRPTRHLQLHGQGYLHDRELACGPHLE